MPMSSWSRSRRRRMCWRSGLPRGRGTATAILLTASHAASMTLRRMPMSPSSTPVALMLLIPGSGNAVRANGRAHLSVDPELLASFKVDGKAPRSVMVMNVEEIYFQCARAIVRSDLWNPDKRIDPKTLPTPGQILAGMSDNRVGGEDYDRAWPERARQSLWYRAVLGNCIPCRGRVTRRLSSTLWIARL